jgi:hypothetical protein
MGGKYKNGSSRNGSGVVKYIDMALNRDKWSALAKVVNNLVSTQCNGSLDYLSNHQLLKKESSTWRQAVRWSNTNINSRALPICGRQVTTTTQPPKYSYENFIHVKFDLEPDFPGAAEQRGPM